MKTKTTSKLILTVLILFIFSKDLSAQTNFEDVAGEPVLSWGDNTGDWDWGAVWHPSVIKDGDTLRMWYSGHDDGIWISNNISSIGYAWSLDGIDWNKDNTNPVLSAGTLEWEGLSISQCAVILEADTFKMWYGADHWESPTSYVLSPSKKIGYAWSLNGTDWTKQGDPVMEIGPASDWDDDFIVPYSVIKEENEYRMWYYAGTYGFPGEGAFPQIGLATSQDGLEWTKYDKPETTEAPYANSDPVMKLGLSGEWDSERTFEPMVMKTDTGYFMFYTGLKSPISSSSPQEIGFAYSSDGIQWNRDVNNPIIKDDNSFVEWGHGIYNGTAIQYDGKLHFWFACFHTPPVQAYPQIGYATSDIDTKVKYQQTSQVQLIHLYPNPFYSSTSIEYEVGLAGIVSITIYNHVGELIEIIEKEQSQGKQQVVWNAEGLPAGIYFCVLITNQGIQTTKMIKL